MLSCSPLLTLPLPKGGITGTDLRSRLQCGRLTTAAGIPFSTKSGTRFMKTKLALASVWLLLASASLAQGPDLLPLVRIESGVSGHIHPALCITKKGTLVAVFCKSEYQPYLITRSTDGGKTWSKPELFPH